MANTKRKSKLDEQVSKLVDAMNLVDEAYRWFHETSWNHNAAEDCMAIQRHIGQLITDIHDMLPNGWKSSVQTKKRGNQMKKRTLPESAGIFGVRFLNHMAIEKNRLPDFAKEAVSACSKTIARRIPWDAWRERIEGNLGVSTDALIALGFKPWSDTGDMELWLFPYWLLPFIPEGFPVVAIDGERLNFNKDDIDDNIRFGVIAYGIEVPRPQKEDTPQ